jgi:hypothetical protein
MTAWLIVRAEVPEADRADFDRWYGDEHLPDAKAAFRAISASRGWSDLDPSVHLAFYEFADLARARAVVGSAEMTATRAGFDRVWQDRVKRTREVVGITQAI